MTVVKVRSLFAELGFQIKNLKKAQEFEDAVENIRAGMEQLASVARRTTGVVLAAAGAVSYLTDKTAQRAIKFQREAQALEVGVEGYQALSYAYQQLGIDQNELFDSFQKLSDRLQKAKQGSKEYTRAINLTGASVRELLDLPMERRYERVLGAIRAMEDPQKRLSALTGIFGETLARKLAPALNQNNNLLEEYMDIAREAGLVMSKEQVEAAALMALQFARVKAIVEGLKKELSLALMPVFDKVIGRIWSWYKANKELIKTQVARFAEKIADRVESLVQTFRALDKRVQSAGGWFRMLEIAAVAVAAVMTAKVGGALFTIIGGLKALFGALTAVGAKALVILAGIILAVLLLVAAWDQLVVSGRGGETLLGNLKKKFHELPTVMKFFTALLEIARVSFIMLSNVMTKVVLPALKMLKPVLIVLAMIIGSIMVVVLAWVVGFFILGAAVLWVVSFILGKLAACLLGLIDLLFEAAFAVQAFEQRLKDWWNSLNPIETAVEAIREKVQAFIDTLMSIPGVTEAAVKFVGGGLPFVDDAMANVAERTAPQAAAQSNAQWAGQNVKVEQITEINVNGAKDPGAVGQDVARRQKELQQAAYNGINNSARKGNR